ncbi:hypothetical protein ACNOYE_17985 [Nannocystaceae bacterium ST9]
MAASATIGRSKKSSQPPAAATAPVVGTSKKASKKATAAAPAPAAIAEPLAKQTSKKAAVLAPLARAAAPVTSKKTSKKAASEPESTPAPAPKKAGKKKSSKQAASEPASAAAPKKKAGKKSSKKAASEPLRAVETEALPETLAAPVETLSEAQKAERARIKAERVAARRAKTEARIAERKAKLERSEPEVDGEPDIDLEPESEPPQPEPVAPLSARDAALIDEIGGLLEQFETIRARASELRRALRNLDHPGAAPGVLALFDRDGDPFQLRTHLLLALERMPEDAYFAALLDAMPQMVEQAPEWAFSAMMRLLNTREHPDDSAFRFEAAARQASAQVREAVAELLLEQVEALPEDQAAMVVQTITGLTRR